MRIPASRAKVPSTTPVTIKVLVTRLILCFSFTDFLSAGVWGKPRGAKVVQEFMTAFPDLVLTMDDVRVEGDRTVYHCHAKRQATR